MSDFRPIAPMPAASMHPGPVGPAPEIVWVDPRTLCVEDRYQRQLGERSATLIRRIVAEWSWSAFKPPIVAEAEDGRLVVIDGQHTATGAASHPGVTAIPVLKVSAETVEGRAGSFLRHNRDRVAMTPMQIHHAAVAAGDEVAVALDSAVRKAGARILRTPQTISLKVGDTMAVGTLRTICKDRGENYTARLLKILVDAQHAPVEAIAIRAVDQLLTDPDWKDQFEPEALVTTIMSRPLYEWAEWSEVNVRKGMKMPRWRALAQAWFLKVRKRRAAA